MKRQMSTAVKRGYVRAPVLFSVMFWVIFILFAFMNISMGNSLRYQKKNKTKNPATTNKRKKKNPSGNAFLLFKGFRLLPRRS